MILSGPEGQGISFCHFQPKYFKTYTICVIIGRAVVICVSSSNIFVLCNLKVDYVKEELYVSVFSCLHSAKTAH